MLLPEGMVLDKLLSFIRHLSLTNLPIETNNIYLKLGLEKVDCYFMY